MHALDVLGDPTRRRLLDLLADGGDVSAGELGSTVMAEFGITQPAVSRHLRLLREGGFVDVRPDGTRRVYSVRGERFAEVDSWLARYRRFWNQRFDALETELIRARKRTTTPTQETQP